MFYQGLKPTLKQFAFRKYDLINDYDIFRIEVRKIEADLAIWRKEEKQNCNTVINTDKKEKSDIDEVKELLQKINQRVDKLEKEREQATNSYDYSYSAGRTFGNGYRGNGRFRSDFRGRGMNRG